MKTVFKYCYASVVLDNAVVLYFEDGFVYNTPVLKNKTATVFFSPNFFFLYASVRSSSTFAQQCEMCSFFFQLCLWENMFHLWHDINLSPNQ